MLKFEAAMEVPSLANARIHNACEILALAVMFCGLAQGAECCADDLELRKPGALPAQRDAPLALPIERETPLAARAVPQFDLGGVCLPDTPDRAGGQFSPRKHFAPDEPFELAVPRADALHTTTVWQRLNDYRSKDRVRLVTLWETSGSSVSLQAGKHGEPSLQWSSRSMNRGGATRGLLDSFVAASLGAAGIAITQPNATRGSASSNAGATVRPVRPATIGAFTSHAP